ncbi:hypothetical protein [Acetonema longum]|uniref:Uncharacterized protein n=1 Tax=Acetonema longum DSM 6540 TaxID=1009370 RepID=F7NJK3_9FIRM|nr:hypothetical protein [Acetonema longum]EGO63781.1 hypothetical protein ALO_11294 [Acetonema longum DSM 6540]
MAAIVLMIKEHEDGDAVVYKFGPDEQHQGRIRLNKKTNMLSELEPVPCPSPKFHFDMAAQRLARCIATEGGIFSERMYFMT